MPMPEAMPMPNAMPMLCVPRQLCPLLSQMGDAGKIFIEKPDLLKVMLWPMLNKLTLQKNVDPPTRFQGNGVFLLTDYRLPKFK